jgi:hypothetical protein
MAVLLLDGKYACYQECLHMPDIFAQLTSDLAYTDSQSFSRMVSRLKKTVGLSESSGLSLPCTVV